MEKTTKNQEVRPFGWRDKVGYMFGDFGNDFTFLLSSIYLMKFYTDVMGVSARAIGNMMMLARIVDAFTDIGMGRLVDKSPAGKDGKFKQWIRRFMGPVALASFLMYANRFKDMSLTFKTVWMFVTYLLWGSICYTGGKYSLRVYGISHYRRSRSKNPAVFFQDNWSYSCSDDNRSCCSNYCLLYK